MVLVLLGLNISLSSWDVWRYMEHLGVLSKIFTIKREITMGAFHFFRFTSTEDGWEWLVITAK